MKHTNQRENPIFFPSKLGYFPKSSNWTVHIQGQTARFAQSDLDRHCPHKYPCVALSSPRVLISRSLSRHLRFILVYHQ